MLNKIVQIIKNRLIKIDNFLMNEEIIYAEGTQVYTDGVKNETSFFSNYFLANKNNNYQPKPLSHRYLAMYAAILLVLKLSLGVLAVAYPLGPVYAGGISSLDLHELVNHERVLNGLEKLEFNPKLGKAAQMKANHMLEFDYWSHSGPEGPGKKDPWFWFDSANYDYLYAGENLAVGFSSPDDVVEAWMNSPAHRKNILEDKYSEIAYAVVPGEFQGKADTVIVQLFGTPNKNELDKQNNGGIEEVQVKETDLPKIDLLAPTSKIRPQAGNYEQKIEVSLSSNDDEARIYYSIDGENPDENDIYENPFILDKTTVVKYYAIDKNGNQEKMNSAVYRIKMENSKNPRLVYPADGELINENIFDFEGYGARKTVIVLRDKEDQIGKVITNDDIDGAFSYRPEEEMIDGVHEFDLYDPRNKLYSEINSVEIDTVPPNIETDTISIVAELENDEEIYDISFVVSGAPTQVKLISENNESELKESDGKYRAKFIFDENLEKYELTIYATDVAGNDATEYLEIEPVLMDSNIATSIDDTEINSDAVRYSWKIYFKYISIVTVAVLMSMFLLNTYVLHRKQVYGRTHHTFYQGGLLLISLIVLILI